jgi:hypothetical protein
MFALHYTISSTAQAAQLGIAAITVADRLRSPQPTEIRRFAVSARLRCYRSRAQSRSWPRVRRHHDTRNRQKSSIDNSEAAICQICVSVANPDYWRSSLRVAAAIWKNKFGIARCRKGRQKTRCRAAVTHWGAYCKDGRFRRAFTT